MCGLTITVLWGKTAGQIFMAGCTDNIRKECNMTPKQWYDMGDSVIQVNDAISQKGDLLTFYFPNSRGLELACGGRALAPWVRTER